MRAAALLLHFSAAAALRLPINFWLLSSDSSPPQLDVQLCNKCCQSIDAGDRDGLEHGLAQLSACSVSVELKPEELDTPPPTRVVQLESGDMAEELVASGPRTFLLPGGLTLRVEEVPYSDGGLGHNVWDASIALAIWLARNNNAILGKDVLELGSGVGMGGLAAGAIGAKHVTLSEVVMSESDSDFGGAGLLRQLNENAVLNELADVTQVEELNWEDCLDAEYTPRKAFSVIIGSDLVHEEVYSMRSLVAAVTSFTSEGGIAYIMSTKGRPGVDQLPHALEPWGEVSNEEFTL